MAAPSKKYAKKKATIKAPPSAAKKPATDDFHAADCAAFYELFGVGNNQPAPSNLHIVQLIVQHRMLSELMANQQPVSAAIPPKHKSGAEAFPTAPSKRVVREVTPATPWQPAPSRPAVRELNVNATPWQSASSKLTVMELNGNATPWQPAQSKPAVIELNANATPWQPAPSKPAHGDHHSNSVAAPASSKPAVKDLNGNATPWHPAPSKPTHGDHSSDSVAAPAPFNPAVKDLIGNATPWQLVPSKPAHGNHPSDSVAAPAPSKPAVMDTVWQPARQPARPPARPTVMETTPATAWKPARQTQQPARQPARQPAPASKRVMKLDDNNIPGQPVPSRPAVMETTPATVCQPAPSKQAVKQWNDRLGKRVIKNIHRFHQCEQDWARYAKSSRTRNHLHEDVGTIQHPAAKFLEHLRTNGVPIRMMDENWTSEMLAERAQRGSHQSTKAYVDFVREEMADFDEKSFWTILPLATIQHIPNLRLSPLGCVPQRDRRPRLINDLSFYEINKNTVCMAPPDAMQFGRALERVLHKINMPIPGMDRYTSAR
jgi:hypothetical protein